MALPNTSTPVSSLAELEKLTANEDYFIVQTIAGTKIMLAQKLGRDLFEMICGNSAQAHNAIYRGKDLTNEYTVDELSAKIQADDWSDLYIGDFIDKEITTSYGGTEKVRLRFAHFDYFLGNGETKTVSHHIVMVPEDAFAAAAAMNASNTTEGGYAGSAMHTTVLPVYAAALKGAMGGGHILSHGRNLTNKVDTAAASTGSKQNGIATAWAWQAVDLCLMSEAMLYGGRVFSSSGYDIADAGIQFALFGLAPNFKIAHSGYGNTERANYWTCGVASAGSFTRCINYGSPSISGAGAASGVRPYFLFA